MIIYVFLVLEIIILNSRRKYGKLSDAAFCKIICASFIIITGLRHNDIGSDTTVYYLAFNNMADRYTTLASFLAEDFFDIGFYTVFWLVAKVFKDFVFMTLLTACVFYIPLSILIYRYSDDSGLSYLSLMAFNFFQFSMTGMKQTMALGFVICLVLEMKKDKPNIKKSILYFILAAAMHRSALAAGLYFVFRIMKNNRMIIKLSFVIIFICYVFRSPLVTMLADLYVDLGYSKTIEFSNGSAGITTYLVYCALIVAGLLCFNQYVEDKANANTDYMAMAVGTIFLGFVSVVSIMFRVGWYFSIMMVIFLPTITKCFFWRKGQQSLANFGLYGGILCMYFFITIGSATVLPYKFFFQ